MRSVRGASSNAEQGYGLEYAAQGGEAIMRFQRIPRVSVACALVAGGASASVASCSNSEPSLVSETGGSSGNPTSSAGSADAGRSGNTPRGDGDLSFGGADSGQLGEGSGGEGDELSKDAACVTSSRATTARPAVLELVVDTSGSMNWPPGWAPKSPNDSKPPGATKWEITREALSNAVSALPAETALGASFYPNVEQSDDVCLEADQAAPIALLGASGSDARAAFEKALAAVDPVGATPTHGAYRFGLSQLTASPLPGNDFVLLITDGTPTCNLACECTENNEPVDPQPLVDEAAAALKDGVRTFVIGSPGSEAAREVLSRLATEGGTARDGCSDAGPKYCHFDMTSEPDLASGLAQALDAISMSVKSCEYPIPAPPKGQTLDPDRVNVLYTPEGAASETVPRDPSTGDCTQGWQYSSDGQNVVLCGDACARAQHESGNVEILFGCQTVIRKPR